MTLIVGERTNMRTWRPRLWPDVECEGYWRLMLRLGAFRDARSSAKLAAIGLAAAPAVNLLPPDPQGAAWDAETAREVALAWLQRFAGYDRVYLAGGRVAAALGARGGPLAGRYGEEFAVGEARCVLVPHPSGLNHFWNDQAAVDRLRLKLAGGRRCSKRARGGG